jgi:hypothetical protein
MPDDNRAIREAYRDKQLAAARGDAHRDLHGRPIPRLRDTNRIVQSRYGRRGYRGR